MTSTATRKIALAMTFTCGGTETRAAPQTKSGNVVVGPATKYVITKSSIESANPSSAALRIAGASERQRDLAERRPLVGAEIHRRLLEVAVEVDQPRLHRDDDVADDEHDVRDEDRPEARDDAAC